MIIKNLKNFSQNVQKNKFLTDTLLEINKDFDIILIQELPWSILWSISSLLNEEGKIVVEVPNYPNWVIFSKSSLCKNDHPHVISYINFFNNGNVFFLLNIYSDFNQSALKYLKDTEVDIHNILIMTGNFNIRDRD